MSTSFPRYLVLVYEKALKRIRINSTILINENGPTKKLRKNTWSGVRQVPTYTEPLKSSDTK